MASANEAGKARAELSPVARLGLYGVALLAVFGLAFGGARMIVPADAAATWAPEPGHGAGHGGTGEDEGGHDDGDADHGSDQALGLSLTSGGYTLTGLNAPTQAGEPGQIELAVLDTDGQPLTDVDIAHERPMHLITVRADGSHFQHLHPELDEGGRWRAEVTWPEAGTYRVFADVTPSATGTALTLSGQVQVSGDFTAAGPRVPTTMWVQDGYVAQISGDWTASAESSVTVAISKDGAPVTTLDPYLGAYGHLVVLRQDDLAYLHAHPSGAEPPDAVTLGGPEVPFDVQVPSPGRYLLYFDFSDGGTVHTASFVLDAPTTGGHR